MEPATAPKHVVASWIWEVLSPEIQHCASELEVLRSTLTFRGGRLRDFERLRPLRSALFPNGQEVFDDMAGEVLDFDSLVRRHDAALDTLRNAARDVYDALIRDSAFEATVTRLLQSQNQSHFGTPEGRVQRLAELLAADVVNDFGAELPDGWTEAALWQVGHADLKAHAAKDKSDTLARAREAFRTTLTNCLEGIRLVRKKLSREHDVPVVPPAGGLQ